MERYDLNAVPNASSEKAGVLRVANSVDEKNGGCTDAAITPSNLHNVLGYRKTNTEYKGNEIVACPYQPGLLLKCVQAGSTSTSPLDTTNVTKGQVITDGGVKWAVIDKNAIEVGGTGATTPEEARENLEVLRRVATMYDNADLNAFTKAGVYMVRKGSATEAEGWTSGIWGTNGFLEVFTGKLSASATYVKQVYRRCGTSDSNDWQICTRQSNDGGATWGEWRRIDNGGEQRTIANTGYYKTVDGLVFAWTQIGATVDNPTTVTKPIPFATLIAQATDLTTNSERDYQTWQKQNTTDTTDTFLRESKDDAFSVFWVGKVV